MQSAYSTASADWAVVIRVVCNNMTMNIKTCSDRKGLRYHSSEHIRNGIRWQDGQMSIQKHQRYSEPDNRLCDRQLGSNHGNTCSGYEKEPHVRVRNFLKGISHLILGRDKEWLKFGGWQNLRYDLVITWTTWK